MWGLHYDQHGTQTTSDAHQVVLPHNVVDFSLGWFHSVYIFANGSVFSTGENGYGQRYVFFHVFLTILRGTAQTNDNTPSEFADIKNENVLVKRVFTGTFFTFIVAE
jgi:alpha-tubulin suppressor-like RCC1 family protein